MRYFASNKTKNNSNQASTNITTPSPHHYQTLNIESTASTDEIKKSYNNLMKQWHPDLYISKSPTQQNEAQKKFLSIREAYEIIINYNQSTTETSSSRGKLDIHKAHGQKHANGFTAGRRTPNNANYSYYSWGRKVYEAQQEQNSENTQEEQVDGDAEEEEEQEIRYSEQYKLKQSYIGKAMEDLYDWMSFLYQRNPSWMQFFLVSCMCAGLVQCLWHWMHPNINDSDPDRIWNVFNAKKKNQGSGYLPSQSAAMESTPNLVSLQPHFKGHTLYGIEGGATNEGESDGDQYADFEQDSTFTTFVKLNINSTVNRDSYKRKRQKEVAVVKSVVKSVRSEKVEAKKKEVKKVRRAVLELNDIPLELRSSPTGILLASQAYDDKEVERLDDNKYDWTSVIKKFKEINEQNERECLQT